TGMRGRGATQRRRFSRSCVLQAEGGTRYRNVTGVQTCARPISAGNVGLTLAGGVRNPGRDKSTPPARVKPTFPAVRPGVASSMKIGRASCRGGGQAGVLEGRLTTEVLRRKRSRQNKGRDQRNNV